MERYLSWLCLAARPTVSLFVLLVFLDNGTKVLASTSSRRYTQQIHIIGYMYETLILFPSFELCFFVTSRTGYVHNQESYRLAVPTIFMFI
jgi:hypothetical protein